MKISMNNFKQLRVMLLTSLIAISFMILSGCSSMNVEEYLPDKKVEYKKSEKVGTDLEVPPDLTNVRAGSELYVPAATSGAGVATYSQFLGEKNIAKRGVLTNSNIMPKVDNISLKKEGAEHSNCDLAVLFGQRCGQHNDRACGQNGQ